MPGRAVTFSTDEIYHIYNRGIDHRVTFVDEHDYRRALLTLEFYQSISPPMKLSHFTTLEKDSQEQIIRDVRRQEKLVEIFSFCFMPNHFHFLLKQKADKGTSKFMSNFQNSYTRFFNTKHERVGPLFLRPFKAVKIYTEEQFLHLSRYIHLNPYSAAIVDNETDLKNYPYSSLQEYYRPTHRGICEKETILSHFADADGYLRFVLDRADYQRDLEEIKRLALDS